MAHSSAPVEEAQSIFNRLGYAVSGDGDDFFARRKWRTVRVSVLASDEARTGRRVLADGGTDDTDLRCFVTWNEYTDRLRDELRQRDTPYEWAVLGVDGDGDYEVVRAPGRAVA